MSIPGHVAYLNFMKRIAALFIFANLSWIASAQENCPAPLDADQDGLIGINDMLSLLSFFGDSDMDFDGVWDSVDDCIGTYDECGICNGDGISPGACNCNGDSLDAIGVCGGFCIQDFDQDGICDEFYDACQGISTVNYFGYDYETLAIGNQCWFQENLKTWKYRDGSEIENGLTQAEWITTSIGACAVYGENGSCENFHPLFDACDSSLSILEFGRLCNWHAISDPRMLCPNGWSASTIEDWMNLSAELGGSDIAGALMKSASGWMNGGNGTNESNFNAIPAGFRRETDGKFTYAGRGATWWTTTDLGDGDAAAVTIYWNSDEINFNATPPYVWGGSVRCVLDN